MESNINYDQLVSDAFKEIKNQNEKLKHVNLLVAGKSGVGKSTLINAIFGEELAQTGVGKPVTDQINLIEKADFPVRIYDTVGFELAKSGFDFTGLIKSFGKNDIQKLIKKVQATETTDDDVHAVWYLISGTGSRIEDSEIEFINWMVEQKLPVIVVLTKCYDKAEAQLLNSEIVSICPNVKAVINVLAKETQGIQRFGVDELIKETVEILPEGLQASFVHSQEASLKLKHSESVKVINASMAATFGTGFSPIPGSDAPLMMVTQTTMLAKITSIFGIDVDKQQVETALVGVLGVTGAVVTGKSLAGNIAKLVPGIGSIGGGLISGGVGMIITGALGYAYVELMELVSKREIDLSAVTPNELTELLVELLPKYLPKQK